MPTNQAGRIHFPDLSLDNFKQLNYDTGSLMARSASESSIFSFKYYRKCNLDVKYRLSSFYLQLKFNGMKNLLSGTIPLSLYCIKRLDPILERVSRNHDD
jgi:hypothetical protein